MNAFKINVLDPDKYEKCPKCNGPLKHMEIVSSCDIPINNQGQFVHAVGNSIDIHSVDESCKDHIRGKIVFCKTCKELMFLYEEDDIRECGDCQHCETLPNNGCGISYRCKWFNCGLNEGPNGRRRSHCSHIDYELVDIPDYAICKICVHCVKQGNDFLCSASHRYLLSDRMTDHDQTCHEFELSFLQYKRYRFEVEEDMTLFDESIHIPEYDALIEEENKVAECDSYLAWNAHKVPVQIKVSMYNNHPDMQIVYICYDGHWFFDRVVKREFLTNLDALAYYRDLCQSTNHTQFRASVHDKFRNLVENELHQDVLEVLQNY